MAEKTPTPARSQSPGPVPEARTGAGEAPGRALTRDDAILSTISIKVPRWVEDEILRVCRETGLTVSAATRIELTELAKITRSQFRKGPALGPFLEHLEFKAEQYNLFFERRR